jgi:hypothetical protein
MSRPKVWSGWIWLRGRPPLRKEPNHEKGR